MPLSMRLAILCFSLILLPAPPSWANSSPNEIVKKADEGRLPGGSLSFLASVKDYEKQSLVRENRYQVRSKGQDASLVETVFPERQQGRKLLMRGDDLWFYTPDIRRPTRVSMQQKLTGEIANGDISRTDFAGDYDATLVGVEAVDGKKAFHLNLQSKRSSVTYAKIDYWVLQDGFLPLRAYFYALSGKLLKRAFYTDIKVILGAKRITKVRIEDALDKGRVSELFYSNQKREVLSDSIFNKDSLSQ